MLCAVLYATTLAIWVYNSRRQFKDPLYSRVLRESPLDDFTHAIIPLEWGFSAGPFRRVADAVLFLGPFVVVALEYFGGEWTTSLLART